MEAPFGFDFDGQRTYVLNLNKSLYGLKQSSSNWFRFLTKGLTDRNFIPSQIDPCIYYKDNCIVLIYVDDCIILSRNKSVIDDFISSLKNGKEKYILTDEGEIDKYLGVDIVKSANTVTMKQPYLIERCLTEMGITDDMNIKKVPA